MTSHQFMLWLVGILIGWGFGISFGMTLMRYGENHPGHRRAVNSIIHVIMLMLVALVLIGVL